MLAAMIADDSRGPRYARLLDDLRSAYDGGAERRDQIEKSSWKVAERAEFLARLRAEGALRLLEIGAGTGQDSAFFAENGLEVVATDLSEAMVARCRAKGVDARVMDVLQLDFDAESFDAVFTFNCLLHVPNADLPAVLERIHTVLRPGGLFYLGVYGGDGSEGVAEWDSHNPPRFFSRRSDEQILGMTRPLFDVVDFHVVQLEHWPFQALTLQR